MAEAQKRTDERVNDVMNKMIERRDGHGKRKGEADVSLGSARPGARSSGP